MLTGLEKVLQPGSHYASNGHYAAAPKSPPQTINALKIHHFKRPPDIPAASGGAAVKLFPDLIWCTRDQVGQRMYGTLYVQLTAETVLYYIFDCQNVKPKKKCIMLCFELLALSIYLYLSICLSIYLSIYHSSCLIANLYFKFIKNSRKNSKVPTTLTILKQHSFYSNW